MSKTETVSPLRQRMIEDMAARKLNPHTQRSRRLQPKTASSPFPFFHSAGLRSRSGSEPVQRIGF